METVVMTMRIRTSWWVAVALGGVVAALGGAGCERFGVWGSCRDDKTCPIPDAGSDGDSGAGGEGGSGTGATGGGTTSRAGGGDTACPEDPAEGTVRDECGIWVRASWPGDDTNPGTQAAPVRTIAAAIALAQKGPEKIHACGETYVEHVDLPAGISLFGGFDCEHGWAYAGDDRRATLAPGVPGVTALTLLDGNGTSIVADVEALAVDATEPGGSSIAVFVMENSRAILRRGEAIAGNGADGADGEPGDHNGAPAQKGLIGKDGSSACAMAPGLGGASTTLQCEDGTVSKSGYGGDGGQIAATGGGGGELEPNPNPRGYGDGGKGEQAALGNACTPGSGGAAGADGSNGLGAKGRGFLSADGHYLGDAGRDGKPGHPGQGGGGGGGSISQGLCAPYGGAGGGAGGTGGCGGKGGQGGQAGGSSIGIAVRAKGMLIDGVKITTGKGGKGGNGGVLQLGGQGGIPGLGGAGMVNGVKGGCFGGGGGQGGKGGNGGGGRGGHSAPIAYTASDADISNYQHINFKYSEVGAGGVGGNPAFPDGTGYPGSEGPFVYLEAQ
jgi:hypothetical protein